MKIPDKLKPFVQNYEVKVFDIAFLDDNIINKFTSDFRYREIKTEISEIEKKGEKVKMCNVAQALENKGIEKGIEVLVQTLKEFGQSNEIIIKKIMENFNLSETEAKKYV